MFPKITSSHVKFAEKHDGAIAELVRAEQLSWN